MDCDGDCDGGRDGEGVVESPDGIVLWVDGGLGVDGRGSGGRGECPRAACMRNMD